jgi:predicted RNase H-like HicB family nuclease
MKFVVSIQQDEDGMYIADCPSIPGCVSQGETEAEAEVNIADAIRECLAVRAELGMSASAGAWRGSAGAILF